MNPFEDTSNNDINTVETQIEMWVETNGRKKNTYISGWNIPDEQLKDHLKTIKKKNGCNGTIKEIPDESSSNLIKILQFQGDHSDFVKQYLINTGVDKSSIRIKG